MTREEILEYFNDINYAYNDCTRYDALKRMIDELQEPCTDAISRQDAIDTFYEYPNVSWTTLDILEKINSLPPVKPTEKVGQWEYNPLDICFQCSQCKCRCEDDYKEPPKYKYCPQCGAKMQEVQDADSD